MEETGTKIYHGDVQRCVSYKESLFVHRKFCQSRETCMQCSKAPRITTENICQWDHVLKTCTAVIDVNAINSNYHNASLLECTNEINSNTNSNSTPMPTSKKSKTTTITIPMRRCNSNSDDFDKYYDLSTDNHGCAPGYECRADIENIYICVPKVPMNMNENMYKSMLNETLNTNIPGFTRLHIVQNQNKNEKMNNLVLFQASKQASKKSPRFVMAQAPVNRIQLAGVCICLMYLYIYIQTYIRTHTYIYIYFLLYA